jgi:hypothetical protein
MFHAAILPGRRSGGLAPRHPRFRASGDAVTKLARCSFGYGATRRDACRMTASELLNGSGRRRSPATMHREADIRARLPRDWEASERGDVDVEHAIYDADAILDYWHPSGDLSWSAPISA